MITGGLCLQMFKKNDYSQLKLSSTQATPFPVYPLQPSKNNNRKYSYMPEKDDDYTQSIPDKQNEQTNNLQVEQQLKLEAVLRKKIAVLQESVRMAQEKSRLKDREIQMNAECLQKINNKIQNMESTLSIKQKRLSKQGKICHEATQQVSKRMQGVRKEALLLQEQTQKSRQIDQRLQQLQQRVIEAERLLQRRKKAAESIQQLQVDNAQLLQYLKQVQSEQKMLKFRENTQQQECKELQNKLAQLKEVANERSKINSKNAAKLTALKKQIAVISQQGCSWTDRSQEAGQLQLELGELNQQLLLLHQDTSQLEYKVSKKKKAVADLQNRLLGHRQLDQGLSKRTSKKHNQPVLTEQDWAGSKSRSVGDNTPDSRKGRSGGSSKANIGTPGQKAGSKERIQSREEVVSPGESAQWCLQVESGASAKDSSNMQKLISRFQEIKRRQKGQR